MCGIFGYIGHQKQAQKIVLEGLKSLEYRGYDSWGVAVVPGDKNQEIVIKKRVGKIGKANVDDLPNGTLSLGHTRWATHGGVTENNAHPHMDCTHGVAVVHNGIVENYEEIKQELLDKGHKFASQTDTEVIVHLIEEYAKKLSFSEAVRATYLRLKGLSAFVAINTKERVMVAVRNGSPLVLGYGKSENFISSDPAGLIPHTREVYYLEDGEMAEVRDDKVKVFEVKSKKPITPVRQHLTWDIESAERGKFDHFMLKEIYEQARVLRDIGLNTSKYLERVAGLLKEADLIYLVGCGSSAFEAQVGSYLLAMIAGVRANVVVGSEFSSELQFLTPKSVVIALSQSGETMDLLEPLKVAKAKGARIVAIVNVLGSSLYRLADEKILLGVGPEKAVASTKAFVGMVAQLILLAHTASLSLLEGKQLVEKASKAVAQVLLPKSITKIRRLAKLLTTHEHLYVVGRGVSYPTALETALKVKEVSYIHAEAISGGELKHGALALITQGTPFIVYLPNDETYQAMLSGAMEMKARGGYMIAVSYKPLPIFDEYIEIPDIGVASVIPAIVFAQLLSYYLAITKKLDPDMPRNLAKSVTVK
ncbi:glutamine--fructose-6-phosphate transaminase (isomerizing) [Candidatus Woesebacteria bacterium]|nr:glutamine--fructose-6-phosphate transaminase (isomerizing) [Candidatus Woesebacteria bacterium]